ncbi:MAG: PAQR family membrane homeostasis protein TrhA [Eubacteriales bacterium]|jgi:hemolysin III
MMVFIHRAREPFNSMTHFIGAVLFGLGTCLLVAKALLGPVTTSQLLALITFGLSMTALYSASSLYHYAQVSPEQLRMLRKLDHSMIYVLIAGSYTPLALTWLPASTGLWFTVFIWSCAFAGILTKLYFHTVPRWLSTLGYLLMGWSILLIPSVFQAMPPLAIALAAAGGISYTIGGIVYWLKKPDLSRYIGFHEFFHLFVLLGSLMHYLMVFLFVA